HVARKDDVPLEAVQRVELAHAPRPRDFAPVRDRDAFARRLLRLMEVRRVEVEALGFHAELRIGDAAFADQDDLLAASEGLDRVRPLLQRRVIRELVHAGVYVTELTGPSQIV